MNLTVSNTNRILRSGNGPTVEYTGQDPIQVNNATHIISLNSAFSAQFAESGVEAKVDELSSCCEQVHSSISSLETQVSSLSSTVETISSEIPDTSDFLTKASADTLYQPIGDYLTHDESGAFQPAGDYILRSESGAFQPSGDYLTTGILNTLATKQDIRVTSSFIQGEIDYISGAISAYPNRDEISAALENIPEYILSGNSNITATSAQDGKNIRWDLRVAATPVVTDTTIVGESGVYAHETQVPGQWQVELTQNAYSAINEVPNKLDKSFSSNFYPMTGNPSGFLTQHQDISNLATKDEVSAYTLKTEVSSISSQLLSAISAVSSEIPDVSNFITNISAEQTYQPIGDYQPAGDYASASDLDNYLTTAQYQVDSATFLTAHQDISNLATKTEVSSYLLKSESANFYPMTGNPSGFLTAHQSLNGYATTAQVNTVSSLLSAGLDYVSANGGKTYTGVSPIVVNNDEVKISAETWDLSAGNGISFTDFDNMGITRLDVTGTFDNTAVNQVVKTYSAAGKWLTAHQSLDNYYKKTDTSSKQEISAALTALNNDLSAAIDYVSANGGKTYTGVAPIQVNNTTDQISITGQSLSAGPNIDIFASGGYIVLSANGGNSFPITGSKGTTAYTANMDCSSVLLTTASSPAGGYVNQTVQGVQYEAYPATNVSASWNNIINAANNRSNCYCIRFTDEMTAADLANYSAYDKVTVVHSNEYTQDCNLYWDGNTKVFPSGLYCELVKGTNDQNQIDWFFTTSGWTNNLWWDWD